MKTKLSLVLVAMALSHYATAQTVVDLGQQVKFGHSYAIDIDGDGDLDLVVGGEEQDGTRNVQLYKNNAGVYTPVNSPLTPLARVAFDWNDINQNGIPDLVTNGFGSFASIYTNDGTGALTASEISLPQIAPNCGFADLNNDGFVDIFVFGNNDIGKSKILFNNKVGGFTESNQFDNYSFVDPQISIVDFDNDKDLDLFITAGYEDVSGDRFSKLFVNNSGVFTETPIANLIQKGNGSSTWGDYNGDGLPDLLLNGDGGINTGEAADNYRLYKNNGDGTFTAIQTFSYRQDMTGGGGAFLDWDNDGDLDLVVTGEVGARSTDIYLNDGAGLFVPYENNALIPGSAQGSIEIGDANGDGQLDLFITGYFFAPYDRAGALIALNPNTNPNTPPTAPTGLAVTGNSAQLNFAWIASTDATTPPPSLTYNFFLRDANNKWYYTPLSDVATGKTKTAKIGNVQYNKGWIVKGLPAGTYTWGVQAIDNSYVGSPFTQGTFTIDANGVLPVKIGEYKAFAEGNSTVIKWQSLSEVNTSKFLIERSIDGVTFHELETIVAKGGSNVQNYVAKDKNPGNGTNYYRLTSIDNDSKTQVFDVLAVSFALQGTSVSVYPNPLTSSVIKIQIRGFDGDELNAKLTAINGELLTNQVIKTTLGNGEYSIQLNKKPAPGIYTLSVTGKQLDRTIKLVVQ